MSGNLICKNNPQLFSFFRFIDNLHNHKSPSRPPGFSLRARAGPGLGPSIKTGLGPSKKGRARVGLGPGLGPDPSLVNIYFTFWKQFEAVFTNVLSYSWGLSLVYVYLKR